MMKISLVSHNANHIRQKFTRKRKLPFDLVCRFKTDRVTVQKANSFFFGSFSVIFYRRFSFLIFSIISSMSELIEDVPFFLAYLHKNDLSYLKFYIIFMQKIQIYRFPSLASLFQYRYFLKKDALP